MNRNRRRAAESKRKGPTDPDLLLEFMSNVPELTEKDFDEIMEMTNKGLERDQFNRARYASFVYHNGREPTDEEREAMIEDTRAMQKRGELPPAAYQYVRREPNA